MFQRIPIAWDGSEVSRRALTVSVDLARRYEGELVALSVATAPVHAETREDRTASAADARAHLADTLAQARDFADRVGVPLEHDIIDGAHPAHQILGYAREHGFELIVVGHHRSGRAGRLLLRGVPEALVAAIEVPGAGGRRAQRRDARQVRCIRAQA